MLLLARSQCNAKVQQRGAGSWFLGSTSTPRSSADVWIEEFREHSERLFADFEAGRLRAVISDITMAELAQAPPEVRSFLERPSLQSAEEVRLDEEAIALADAYIREGVVGEANRVDAQHIAMATVHRVDILVSWNFRHIVKWNRIRAFNAANLKIGYPPLEIRSPREVYHEEGL